MEPATTQRRACRLLARHRDHLPRCPAFHPWGPPIPSQGIVIPSHVSAVSVDTASDHLPQGLPFLREGLRFPNEETVIPSNETPIPSTTGCDHCRGDCHFLARDRDDVRRGLDLVFRCPGFPERFHGLPNNRHRPCRFLLR